MARDAYSGFFGLPRGMNSGISPLLIQASEFARGNNLSVRGGFAETRGGFVADFTFSTIGSNRGSGVWRLSLGDFIVTVIGTTIELYRIDMQQSYSFGPYLNSTGQCYMEQVDRWFCIQDGANRPVVLALDSSDVPYVYGTDDPLVSYPISTIMKYAHSRTHMVPVRMPQSLPDPTTFPTAVPTASTESGRMGFVSSDVRDNLNPEYVFRMSECRTVAGGGTITMPMEAGLIGGMGILRGAATGTGVGPLIVLGREGVSAFDVAIPRTQWFTTNIGQVLFVRAGTKSPWSVIDVSDDLCYIDATGNVRFLRYDQNALSGSSGSLVNQPRSNEMRYFIEGQDLAYLNRVSSVYWDNRLAWTLHGESDYTYKAMGVLDVSPAFTMAAQEPPAYYGVWTGFNTYQVLQARKDDTSRMYLVVKTAANKSALLRYDEDALTDPSSTPILSTLITGSYSFATPNVATVTDTKRLDYVDLWLGEIKRDTELEVYYRPRGYEVWTLMGSKTVHVPGGPAQSRRQLRISLDLSSETCNAVDQKPLNISDRFEFMIRWRGWCRIEAFRPVATKVTEEDPDICDTDNADDAVLPTDTLDPDFDYEVTL